MSEPKLLGLLTAPRDGALRTTDLETDRVLAARRDLRDHARAARTAAEAHENVAEILRRHRHVEPLDVAGSGERLYPARRPPSDGNRRREVGEHLLDLQPGD